MTTQFTPEQAAKIRDLHRQLEEAEGLDTLKAEAKKRKVKAVETAVSSTIDTLTVQQRTFLIHYLAGENKTEAARIAGYSNPDKQGSRLSREPKIMAAIDEYMATLEMGERELIRRMSEQARNIQANYIMPDGRVDLARLIADGNQHLVKGTRYDARGNLVVEFVPTFESQVQIGKYLKLWTENIDHTTGGDKLPQTVIYLPSNDRD